MNTQDSVFYMEETFTWNCVDWAGASSRREVEMARKGNNCGVLLKKIAAMFTFSLSVLTYIGRQDGEWELLLKYDRDDVHNYKTFGWAFSVAAPTVWNSLPATVKSEGNNSFIPPTSKNLSL